MHAFPHIRTQLNAVLTARPLSSLLPLPRLSQGCGRCRRCTRAAPSAPSGRRRCSRSTARSSPCRAPPRARSRGSCRRRRRKRWGVVLPRLVTLVPTLQSSRVAASSCSSQDARQLPTPGMQLAIWLTSTRDEGSSPTSPVGRRIVDLSARALAAAVAQDHARAVQ